MTGTVMKQITDTEDLVGLTITESQHYDDKYLLLRFDGDAFAVIVARYERGIGTELSLMYEGGVRALSMGDKYGLGLISEDEYQAWRHAESAKSVYNEKVEYLRLKKKYGNNDDDLFAEEQS